MGIETKTPAQLTDEISIVNIKIFFLVEKLQSKDDAIVASAAREVNQLNSRRTKLLRALDQLLGYESIPDKTY